MDLHNGNLCVYNWFKQEILSCIGCLKSVDLPKDVLLHSDQGSGYTSAEYYNLCKEKALSAIMSRRDSAQKIMHKSTSLYFAKCEAFYIKDE